MDLWLKIDKTNVTIRISIYGLLCVPIFRQNEQLWFFRPKFAQKWILGSEFQICKSRFVISTCTIPCLPFFSKNGLLWLFRSKFGETENYVRYFGSNNVEGFAESWIEAEMCWVEVDGAEWRLKCDGWRWMELSGAGWSWA